MNHVKKILPTYVICFVFSFMLYIFEPITMYLNNPNDLWFDLNMVILPLVLTFLFLFLFLAFFFTIMYFITSIALKKNGFYNFCVLAFFIIFICTYIQGNYLSGWLPALNGDSINWKNSSYLIPKIIMVIMFIIFTIILIISTIKLKFNIVIKYAAYISLAVFLMLNISLISTILTNGISSKKNIMIATNKNLDNASTDKNFFILLLDAVDSVMFEEAMNGDDDFKNTFEDFTYYKDTMSTYAYTRDSVPYILTNTFNKNKSDFRSYSINAYDNSKFLDKLEKMDYERNLYDSELIWDSNKAKKISNLTDANNNLDMLSYIKQQTKYILFKYLPYSLKKYSKINTMEFESANNTPDKFTWWDDEYYLNIQNNDINRVDNKVFSFIHLEGAHVPYLYNKELKITKAGNYHDTLLGNLTIIDTYLNRLKENDVYDNSVIIIMSDHGYSLGNGAFGRQNPILFIKGINEHHKMIKSDLPISYTDLDEAYNELLDDKKSTDLFKNIDKNRERKFIWYEYTKEDHMVEYIQKGKAWDLDTLVKTGKEFNR